MAKRKDPGEVVQAIRRSIEVSPKRSRRVRVHSLRGLFGFDAWSNQRKELVARLFTEQGLVSQPDLRNAALGEWVVLTMPDVSPEGDYPPESRPQSEWFEHLHTVQLDTEREVEMHFASPLFARLGYAEQCEAVGFRVPMSQGRKRQVGIVDLLYFSDNHHSLTEGVPLVLVECKVPNSPDDATAQAKSYANWVRPAFYVTTDGIKLVVHKYLGAIDDEKVLEVERTQLRDRFDEIFGVLSRAAALEARRATVAKLAAPRE
jgi:hypothetical protein